MNRLVKVFLVTSLFGALSSVSWGFTYQLTQEPVLQQEYQLVQEPILDNEIELIQFPTEPAAPVSQSVENWAVEYGKTLRLEGNTVTVESKTTHDFEADAAATTEVSSRSGYTEEELESIAQNDPTTDSTSEALDKAATIDSSKELSGKSVKDVFTAAAQ